MLSCVLSRSALWKGRSEELPNYCSISLSVEEQRWADHQACPAYAGATTAPELRADMAMTGAFGEQQTTSRPSSYRQWVATCTGTSATATMRNKECSATRVAQTKKTAVTPAATRKIIKSRRLAAGQYTLECFSMGWWQGMHDVHHTLRWRPGWRIRVKHRWRVGGISEASKHATLAAGLTTEGGLGVARTAAALQAVHCGGTISHECQQIHAVLAATAASTLAYQQAATSAQISRILSSEACTTIALQLRQLAAEVDGMLCQMQASTNAWCSVSNIAEDSSGDVQPCPTAASAADDSAEDVQEHAGVMAATAATLYGARHTASMAARLATAAAASVQQLTAGKHCQAQGAEILTCIHQLADATAALLPGTGGELDSSGSASTSKTCSASSSEGIDSNSVPDANAGAACSSDATAASDVAPAAVFHSAFVPPGNRAYSTASAKQAAVMLGKLADSALAESTLSVAGLEGTNSARGGVEEATCSVNVGEDGHEDATVAFVKTAPGATASCGQWILTLLSAKSLHPSALGQLVNDVNNLMGSTA